MDKFLSIECHYFLLQLGALLQEQLEHNLTDAYVMATVYKSAQMHRLLKKELLHLREFTSEYRTKSFAHTA